MENANIIYLHILSVDVFWVRVTRSGDFIIIRPNLTMNDVPTMLEKGWVHTMKPFKGNANGYR